MGGTFEGFILRWDSAWTAGGIVVRDRLKPLFRVALRAGGGVACADAGASGLTSDALQLLRPSRIRLR